MRVQFTEWAPDRADLSEPFMTIARGCIAGPKGYRPFPAQSNSNTPSALTARCQGAAAFISPIDEQVYWVAGDATDLYQRNGTSADSASRSGGYSTPADDFWEFVALSGDIIAVQIGDIMQRATMNGTLAFANLPTSTLVPRARHIGVIGQHAMIGNVEESGVRYPNRIRWHGVDANGLATPADWDASQTTMADFQDLEDGLGGVQKVVGGERYGLILCDHGVARADFTGTPDIYVVNKLVDGVGCIAPGSAARFEGWTYYLSPAGFVRNNGLTTERIGAEKIDAWFFTNVYGPTLYHRISACVDPERKLYIVGFPSAASSGAIDYLLFFHIPTGKWTYQDGQTLQYLLMDLSPGVTLEDLDTHPLGNTSIDAMTISLDSKIWAGGEPRFGAFHDTSNAFRLYNGANLAATLETWVIELVSGHRAMIDHARPLVDGGAPSVTLAMRERLNDSETFGSAVSQNADGICPFETGSTGRFAKVRASMAGSGTWTHYEAVDLMVKDRGMF